MRSLASPICRSKRSVNCCHGTGNPPRLIAPLSGLHDRSCSTPAKAMSPRPSAHACGDFGWAAETHGQNARSSTDAGIAFHSTQHRLLAMQRSNIMAQRRCPRAPTFGSLTAASDITFDSAISNVQSGSERSGRCAAVGSPHPPWPRHDCYFDRGGALIVRRGSRHGYGLSTRCTRCHSIRRCRDGPA
jgi:hypothetical protein